MLSALEALNESETKLFDSPDAGAVPRIYNDYITVPDAHLLFNGAFKRVGTSDLNIVGDDGQSFFIPGYFDAEQRAHLMSPEGATLTPRVVEALAGPLAPGQFAQAGAQPAPGQPVIGRVDALSGSATVVRNGVSVALNIGDTVRRGDVVQTGSNSSVAIVFADGTTFNVNASARMVLDDFVYQAGGTANSALFSLVQGTFSLVAGQVAKSGDMRVETPVATMGIRGTAVLVEISSADGQTRFSVMVEPDGSTGAFNLYNKTTGALIGTVNNSQIGWVVSPVSPVEVLAVQEVKTPAQLQQELGIVQQIFNIFNNNQLNPFTPEGSQEKRGETNDINPQTAGGYGSSGPLDTAPATFAELLSIFSGSNLAPAGFVQPLLTELLPPPDPSAPPSPAVVNVSVAPNQPPVAINDLGGPDNPGVVILNDSDPEGGGITVVSVRPLPGGTPVLVQLANTEVPGPFGTLFISPDGTYSFVPAGEAYQQLASGEAASATFEYTISDSFATASAVLTINLSGQNDAPVVSAVDGDATEDGTAIAVTLGGDDVDSDDNPGSLVYSIVNGPPSGQGSATIEDNKLVFDPGSDFQDLAEGETRKVEITYKATDSHNAASTTSTVTVTVTGANDAPTVSAVVGDADEDGAAIQVTLAGDDVDSDDNTGTLIYAIVSGPPSGQGSATIEDNKLVFDPGSDFQDLAEGETRKVEITYRATDKHGATSTIGTVTITVTGTNDVPKAEVDVNDVQAAGFVDSQFTIGDPFAHGDVLENDDDVDNDDALTVTGASFGVTAATFLFGVYVVAGKYGILTIKPDGTYLYTLNNLDPDTIRLAEGQTDTEIFTYTIADEHGASASSTLTINVTGANSVPVITGDASGSVIEDGLSASGQPRGDPSDSGDLDAVDPDANTTITWSLQPGSSQTLNGDGSVTGRYGTLSVSDDGQWTYLLNDDLPATQALALGQTVTERFTVKATDEHGESTLKTVTITVRGSNDAPVIAAGETSGTVIEAGFDENGELRGNPTACGQLSKTDVDSDDNASNDTWSVEDGQGQYGALTVDQNGKWTYTLDEAAAQSLTLGETKIESFTVKVTDRHGASDTETVTIEVISSNDAPTAETNSNDVQAAGLVNGQPTLGDAFAHGNVLIDDEDVDGDSLTVTAVSYAGAAATLLFGAYVVQGKYGFLTLKPDGTYLYTLNNLDPDTIGLSEGDPRADVFTYTVKDQHGATAQTTLTINVAGANSAPSIIGDASGSVIEAGLSSTGQTRGDPSDWSDLDVLDPDKNDITIWSLQPASSQTLDTDGNIKGRYGTFSIDDTGRWTYQLDDTLTPTQGLALGQTVTERFTVNATDDHGASALKTVTVTIRGSNDAPVISGGQTSGSVTEAGYETPETPTASGRLSKLDFDTDDNSNNDTWSVQDGQGQYGTLTVSQSGKWTYTLDNTAVQSLKRDETKTETFTVEVTDSHNASDTQLIEITVQGSNDAPVVAALTRTIGENAESFSVDLLSNTSDPDGDVLSIEDVDPTVTTSNSLVLTEGDHYTIEGSNFQLTDEGFALFDSLSAGSQDSFELAYEVTDGLTSKSNTLIVTVNGANDAPTGLSFVVDSDITSASSLGSGKTLGTFQAEDSDNTSGWTYALTHPSGLFSISSTGDLKTASGIPDGTYTIEVTATDASGASSGSVPFTIWVGNGSDNTVSLSALQNDALAFGFNGKDTINTGSGDDTVVGGRADDTLEGSSGDDTYFGNAGHDTFIFRPGDGKDVITDMTLGAWDQNANADVLVLEGFQPADVTLQQHDNFLRILLANNQWIDLNGIQADTLESHNLVFTNAPLVG